MPPGFTILDDEHKQTLMREAIDHALNAAAESVGSPLYAALQTVIVHAVDDQFDKLLEAMIGKRDWSDAVPPTMPLGKEAFADAEASCRAALGIRKGATRDGVTRDILALLPREDIQRAVDALNGGTANDLNAAVRLRPALQSANPDATINALASFFLTGEGLPRKSLMTKPTAARHPDLDAQLSRAQGRFVALDAERRALTRRRSDNRAAAPRRRRAHRLRRPQGAPRRPRLRRPDREGGGPPRRPG